MNTNQPSPSKRTVKSTSSGTNTIGTTSAGIAYAHGLQDAQRISRDAMVKAVATIVGAVSCPVSADIEAGYGPSAADVAATVDAVLDAGVVGINLEDSTHGGGGASLFGIDQQSARISAAREAAERRGLPLVINARTDTFLLGLGSDIEERHRLTVERGLRYLRAGADLGRCLGRLQQRNCLPPVLPESASARWRCWRHSDR